ncbi:ribokinase [Pseudosulfitobacter sp. DSM 107133]|uniref:ribokinase n=1 Tax=Pseudosulfitobacter sp. DSM 107133 TaxID=2883100 RepID=UPI000DF3AF37|nr:ribokinase [Pseudosulfitobacter sp. DSM 107133]UOA29179.1 Ribokinase [Pseudosulfitobacter sp. DSM 107133]
MSEVTIVGSINTDLTSYLPCWPKIGETVNTTETRISLGGKGANQAVAASRMGARTTIIGAVGADTFGTDIEQQLRAHGLDAKLTVQRDMPTGMAFIDVGPDGDNLIRLSAGANYALTPQIIETHADTIANSKVVVLQNEIPFAASFKAAQIAKAAGALVVMDPAPAPEPFWERDKLAQFDIVTPNSHETKLITGAEPRSLSEAQEAARKLQDYGAAGSIVTMGSKGVAWCINGQSGQMTAPGVNAIDTVCAGDCFNGAFAAAHVSGKSVRDAIEFAVHAAALTTTRKGATDSIPCYEDLCAVLALG